MQTRNRKRMQLVLIASLFAIPVLLAALLANSGWIPGARSYGQGIVPQRTVGDAVVTLADGSRLDWHDPDWRWSVAVMSVSLLCATNCPLRCADRC